MDDIMATKKGSTDSEKLVGHGMSLGGLVEYQQGSVVSREVIGKKTGTVTIFAFDEGEGLSEHMAPFDAMVYIVEGEANIDIDRKPHHLKAGDMIVLPADHPHALQAIKPFKMLLIMIRS
jgi:quercetin dioxygenase-like cupin family protein